MRSRYLRVLGLTVHVADHGGAGAPVVLVHGLGGAHTNWNLVAPSLTRFGRVLAVDLPGFGLSPPSTAEPMETHRLVVESLTEEVGGGPALLIGNSMGGLIAEMVASHRPDLVERMVLFAPATPPVLEWGRFDPVIGVRLLAQSLPVLGSATTRMIQAKLTPRELVDAGLSYIAARPIALDALFDAYELAERRQTLPWRFRAFNRSAASIRHALVPRSRFDEMLRAVTAPTMVIAGDADRVVSPASIDWLQQRRPDWRYHRIPGVGHVPMLEAPSESLKLMEEFLTAG